jgi:hypothetical protein
MDSNYVPPLHTQPLQLVQSLAMATTITESDRSDLIEMLHELAKRRRRISANTRGMATDDTPCRPQTDR